MKYARTNDRPNRGRPAQWSAHRTGKSRGHLQRAGRVELLLTDPTVYDGGGSCREFGFSFGGEAVSAGCFDFVYRLRVLSSVARERVPAPAKRDRLGSFVGVSGFRSHLDPLSSSNGERGSRLAGTVIP